MRTSQSASLGDTVILRCRAVSAKTGLSVSSLYELISVDAFPKPIVLSKRRVGWVLSEVEDWLRGRIKATREEGDRAQPIRRRRPAAQGGDHV